MRKLLVDCKSGLSASLQFRDILIVKGRTVHHDKIHLDPGIGGQTKLWSTIQGMVRLWSAHMHF